MKFLPIALVFLVASAQAETITLADSGCDANRNCFAVTNDESLPMALYASPTALHFYLYIDGLMYVGQGTAGDINQVATTSDGLSTVQVQVSFRHWTTKVVSGRLAGRVTQHYEIVGGQVTR